MSVFMLQQTPGIFLDLAASGLDNIPQAIHLREQTDSITPTVVFADLQGRLSTSHAQMLLL